MFDSGRSKASGREVFDALNKGKDMGVRACGAQIMIHLKKKREKKLKRSLDVMQKHGSLQH